MDQLLKMGAGGEEMGSATGGALPKELNERPCAYMSRNSELAPRRAVS